MMLKEERQQQILNLLYENGKVAVDELAQRFHASRDTIRRDLSALEEEGVVRRVYGGAVPDKHPALAIDARTNIDRDAKYLVARKAVGMLRPDTLIGVDGGSTNVLFASLMPLSIRLRVVTNSFPVANELRKRPKIDVVFLGGIYNKESQTTVGDTAIGQLREFHFDQCFLGAYAIDREIGITVPFPYEDEAAVKRCFVESSGEVNIMGACSKLDRVSNYVICPVGSVTKIICEHPVTDYVRMNYLDKIV